MVRTTSQVAAPADRVFAVLADAWTYEQWVVGCREIRAVDESWPAPGATFHHSVGIGPIAIRDTTTVIESDAPHRIVLRARALPAGVARVEIDMTQGDRGTEVAIAEEPLSGPTALLRNPLQDLLVNRRNREGLRRLKRLAEQP